MGAGSPLVWNRTFGKGCVSGASVRDSVVAVSLSIIFAVPLSGLSLVPLPLLAGLGVRLSLPLGPLLLRLLLQVSAEFLEFLPGASPHCCVQGLTAGLGVCVQERPCLLSDSPPCFNILDPSVLSSPFPRSVGPPGLPDGPPCLDLCCQASTGDEGYFYPGPHRIASL